MNKNLKLVILIVVLVSAVFGGYFAWGFLKTKKELENSFVQYKDEAFYGWSVYKNSKYGYEIKYPDDFSFKERSKNLVNIFHKSKKSNHIEINVLGEFKKQADKEEFQEIKVEDLRSFQNFVKNYTRNTDLLYTGNYKYYYAESIKLNGNDAIILKNRNNKSTSFIFVYHDHLIFEVLYSAFPGYEESVMKIVSSFKFINLQFSKKGSLLIYDPEVEVSELHGRGFEPFSWYLIDKDKEWKDALKSPEYNLKLIFTNDSECIYPKSKFNDLRKNSCLDKRNFKWGSGDRVRVYGVKDGNSVKVEKMEIVSGLPIEEW